MGATRLSASMGRSNVARSIGLAAGGLAVSAAISLSAGVIVATLLLPFALLAYVVGSWRGGVRFPRVWVIVGIAVVLVAFALMIHSWGRSPEPLVRNCVAVLGALFPIGAELTLLLKGRKKEVAPG